MKPGFTSPVMMQFKKLAPSRLYRSKSLEQMSWRLRLSSSVTYLGTNLAETLRNPRQSSTKKRPFLD